MTTKERIGELGTIQKNLRRAAPESISEALGLLDGIERDVDFLVEYGPRLADVIEWEGVNGDE